MSNAKILVVDDEPPILDMLTYNLKRANYEVITSSDGEQAVNLAQREHPDLVILDLMLPRLDGLEVCRILRREQDIPIIMLTARDTEVDRVVGLELGADDYVVKPFSVRELMVRVRNVLRRATYIASPTSSSKTQVGNLTIDPARREAFLDAVALDLTALEFEVLHAFARHAGMALTREQLLQEVWGYDYLGDTRVVDAVIKRLRSKLNQASSQSEVIMTIRGVGYKMLSPE
ncbi:MAG: response regulator transcription factor [Dehalococcoidia bacterium]|nr:response regulator transcription factor [Dehalococcoidia bacterium]